MNSRCISYLSDRQYLLPTLLSAVQARARTSQQLADVVVISTQPDARSTEVFSRVSAREGLLFLTIPDHVRDTLESVDRENPGHFLHKISVSALGRLFMHRILPAQYREFLYIDGDTQVTDTLDRLIGCDVPAGKFLAARDYCSIFLNSARPWVKDFNIFARQLGLPPGSRTGYFNSGVIRVSRDTWQDIGPRAFDYFIKFPERCHNHLDQAALNGACRDALIMISSRWNFPRHLMHLDLGDRPKPAIYHYLSNPKPWHGVFLPWGTKEHGVYIELVRRYPELAEYLPRLSPAYLAAYKLKTTRNYILDLWRARSDQVDLDEILKDNFLLEPSAKPTP